MYGYISGTVKEIDSNYIIIDNNGTPLNLREQLDNIWDERIESVL